MSVPRGFVRRCKASNDFALDIPAYCIGNLKIHSKREELDFIFNRPQKLSLLNFYLSVRERLMVFLLYTLIVPIAF